MRWMTLHPAGREMDPVWRDEVEHVSHRHYGTGFYYRAARASTTEDSRYIRSWQVCRGRGKPATRRETPHLESLRNKFSQGDEVELVGPGL